MKYINLFKNVKKSGYLRYVNSDFFNLSEGMDIRFSKGPFVNFVSKIVEIQKEIKNVSRQLFNLFGKKENCLSLTS